MPRLNFRRNTGPFTTGRRLPLASIEKVYIRNNIEWSNPHAYWSPSGTGEGVSVTVNIHLQSMNVQKPESFLEESGDDIFVYVVLVLGSVEIESIKRKTNKIMSYMRDTTVGEHAEADTSYIIPGSSEEDNILIYKNFTKATLSDFTYIKEDFIDHESDDLPVYKYSTELEIPMYGTYDNFSDLFDNAFISEDGLVDYTNATLFCFTSYYNLDVATATDAPWEVSSVLLGTAEDNIDQYHYPVLVDMKTSDLTYEEVFISAEVADGPRTRYIFNNGSAYEFTPIKDFSGRHRAAPEFQHDIVKSIFDDFAGLSMGESIQTEPTGNSRVRDLLDNVLSIISEKYNDPDILIELNKLKQAWPEKSTATAVGRIYEAFRKLVEKSNEIVSAFPALTRQIFQNYKIIDFRVAVDTAEYSPPDTTVDISSWFSPTRDRIYDDIAFTRIGFDSDADIEFTLNDVQYVQNKGFIFFDYEKAIYNDTNIARVLDTTRIDDLFGKSFLNPTFTIETVYYFDFIYGYSDDIKSRMTAYYEDALDENGAFLIDRPTIDYIELASYGNEHGYASINLAATDLTPATTLYSYLAHRNVVPALDEDYEDYRLYAIEVSDVQAGEQSHRAEGMYFYVQLVDNTLHALTALTSSYYNTYLTLQEYYNAAADDCSYNNIDLYFNTFFADHINAQYAGDELNAPWNRAPIIYNIHRDLLYGTYGGNKTEIIDDAKKITVTISPETGNLSALLSFFEEYEQLWATFYESGTDFNSTVEGISQTKVGYLNKWIHGKEYVVDSIASNPWFIEREDPDLFSAGVPEIYFSGEYTDEADYAAQGEYYFEQAARASFNLWFDAVWENLWITDWWNADGEAMDGAQYDVSGAGILAWADFTDTTDSIVDDLVDAASTYMSTYSTSDASPDIPTSKKEVVEAMLTSVSNQKTSDRGSHFGVQDNIHDKLVIAINTIFEAIFGQSMYAGGKCYTNNDCYVILVTDGTPGLL